MMLNRWSIVAWCLLVLMLLADIASHGSLAAETDSNADNSIPIDIVEDRTDEYDRTEKKGPPIAEPCLFEKMFGSTLYSWGYEGEGEKQQVSIYEAGTNDLLAKKKVVAVYFSASWCGPCKQFTPILTKLYQTLQKQHPGKFEVVWVSGDRSADEFVAYYQKMPWLAVTMENVQSVMQQLGNTLRVKGIPHLVLLDGETGEVLSYEGRKVVMEDPHGLTFPYQPKLKRILSLFIPRSLRQYLLRHTEILRARIQRFFQTLLDSILPGKLLQRLLQRMRKRQPVQRQ